MVGKGQLVRERESDMCEDVCEREGGRERVEMEA